MSLSSTSTLKSQLTVNLGSQAQVYFESLSSFVSGKTSRQEFEQVAKQLLTTPTLCTPRHPCIWRISHTFLVQLHNALIISLFDATATLKRPPTPPPPAIPKPPPTKRRRTLLPYQGPGVPEDLRSIRSARIKRWTLSMGKRERDRLKMLQDAPAPIDPPRPRKETDEIANERGIELLPERGETPGSRLPIHFHSSTRAPTLQHVAERMNLICAQNNLPAPARSVPALMSLACDVCDQSFVRSLFLLCLQAKLKQLITHALTLTCSSSAISSISPSSSSASTLGYHHPPSRPPVLTPDSFHTLFTVSPADIPNRSAAAMRFAAVPPSLVSDAVSSVI